MIKSKFRPKPSFIHSYDNNKASGQSYKASTIVIYDSRVVTWGIFKSGMTLESYITIVEAL